MNMTYAIHIYNAPVAPYYILLSGLNSPDALI